MSDPIAPIAPETGVQGRYPPRRGRDRRRFFAAGGNRAPRKRAQSQRARGHILARPGCFSSSTAPGSTWCAATAATTGSGSTRRRLQQGADAATRRDILALRTDPEISARMAGEFARENAETLQARLGRAPSAGELYAAHVMGPAGQRG